MKILHYISKSWAVKDATFLKKFGINVIAGETSSFSIEEEQQYFQIIDFINGNDIIDAVNTEFTKKEIEDTELFVILGASQIGYPQPENQSEYLNLVYDLSEYCNYCGIGYKQINPFRIKKEPIWKAKNLIFQLFWIGDAFFASKSFFDSNLKDLGIESLPVLLHKKGEISQNVVQIKIPVLNEKLSFNLPFEICSVCNRIKYAPFVKGFYPKPNEMQLNMHIVCSQEYFGSGGSAFKRVFISKDLKNMLLKNKIINNHLFIPTR